MAYGCAIPRTIHGANVRSTSPTPVASCGTLRCRPTSKTAGRRLLAHAGETGSVSPGPASLTMSSADSSPGTYPGNLDAGKIDNNEIAPTIKNDACTARSMASALIATASTTCAGVVEVASSTLLSSWLVTKLASSERTSAWSLGGNSDRLRAEARNTPSSPTATTLAAAAPSAFETLFATPRNAPTSPASRLGDADTSTLNSSVSSVSSPIPTRRRPRMTATVLQSLPTVKATTTRPIAIRMNEAIPRRRGETRSYSRTERTPAVAIATAYGRMTTAEADRKSTSLNRRHLG